MIAMSGNIKVMNPDLMIRDLDEGATLNKELNGRQVSGTPLDALNDDR